MDIYAKAKSLIVAKLGFLRLRKSQMELLAELEQQRASIKELRKAANDIARYIHDEHSRKALKSKKPANSGSEYK